MGRSFVNSRNSLVLIVKPLLALCAFAFMLSTTAWAQSSIDSQSATETKTDVPAQLPHVKRAEFKLIHNGVSATIETISAQRVEWSLKKPAALKVMPKGLVSPLFGILKLGVKEKLSEFLIVLDAPRGKPSRLFIDVNRNGDLADDPKPLWNHQQYDAGEGAKCWISTGFVFLPVSYGKKTVSLKLKLSRYDTTEPERMAQFLPLICTADYATEGDLKFGDKTVHAVLTDARSYGDFRGTGVPGNSGVYLWLDRNSNGKMDARGENYDSSLPFNIGGVTYELRNMSPDGTSFDLALSARTVPEIAPPPDLSINMPALHFSKIAVDGRTVSFPQDYKGKKVLLYFWATWCGDCQREMPGVVSAYKKFRNQGLEILGVTVQHPNDSEEVAGFIKSHEIDWTNIFEGEMWSGELAQLYYVMHTPTPFLVDGDSGKIIASGLELLGDRLEETVKKKLTIMK